jgi:hypothetical protein
VFDRHPAAVVVERVDEDGDAQFGPAEGVGDGPFVTEVRQGDEHAIDLVTVRPEEVGALARVLQAFDGAVRRRSRIQGDYTESLGFEHLQDLWPARFAQVCREETAIANDKAECRGS